MKKFAALFLVFTLSLSTVAFASPSMTDNHDGTFTYDRTGVVVNSSNEKVDQVAPSAGMSAELTMLSNASASTVKVGDFTDVPSSHWAKAAIDAMTAKGVLKGVGNNKFEPEAQVSRAQFVAMTIRAYGQSEEAIAAKQGNIDQVSKGNNGQTGFTINVITAAQEFGLTDNFGYGAEDWTVPANRAEMAYIIMTVSSKMGGEDFAITDGIKRNVGDYQDVNISGYGDAILKAYSAGILVGTDADGNYKPSNNSTRAQAATVMQRLLDPSMRTKVEVKDEQPAPVPPTQDGANIGEYATYPKEGDMHNGKPITRDPVTGVLGFGNGQKGGIYLGITMKSAVKEMTIEVGTCAAETYDNMTIGDGYIEKHGYIFWGTEWNKIENVAFGNLPEANSVAVGTKADINGHVIKSGDKTTQAFWVVKEAYPGYNNWSDVK